MATDLEQIVRELTGLYDFTRKTVIAVGAGGGQLAGYARHARRVIAVDNDPVAMERLTARLRELGLADEFVPMGGDFLAVQPSGDVVVLEFCLHEMPDPGAALAHALKLAPDVVVIDHAPGSQWSWYAAEGIGVDAAWQAVSRRPVRRFLDVEAFQRFQDYGQLEAKMVGCGPVSLTRIAAFRNQSPISIPMPYRLALLGSP